MYKIYEKLRRGASAEYRYVRDTHLFGCNNGWIPYLVQQQLKGAENEPLPWHVDGASIARELEADPDLPKGNTLVIDLKPRDSERLSLYEILNIWGYSANGWTPVMLHLRGLFVDASLKTSSVRRERFAIADRSNPEPIFTFHHIRKEGTVRRGRLVGPWVGPRASSTNSALLWPDAFRYFATEAGRILDKR